MKTNEPVRRAEELHAQLPPEDSDALAFYRRNIYLPRATFANRCSQLPCILLYKSGEPLPRAAVSFLGQVEFRTAKMMPLKKPQKLVSVHPWLRDLCDPSDGSVSDDKPEVERDVCSDDEPEAESIAGSRDSIDDTSASTSPLHAEPSAPVNNYTQAPQSIARLGRPFTPLLLEQQSIGQYERITAEHETICSGVPHQINTKDIRAKVLEII